MNAEHLRKIKGLLDDALKLDAEKRQQFLDDACGNDLNLRREIEELLTSSENVESFMEKPAVGEVAGEIVSREDKLTSGQSLGHYKIIEQLGVGGMGEVYLAKDTKLHRQIALKVLSSDFTQDDDRLRRFVREARATSALNHPNILTIHEIGDGDGLHFIASEYVKGETLRERLEREDLTLRETLEIATQTASALSAAHEAGVVHRDIKPENVMIREDGLVKVLDFGLAKLIEKIPLDEEAETQMQVQTRAGIILGTARYMSPEQARGKETDARTDIFSFGVILYEMLAGKRPFSGETTSDVIAAILTKEPAPLGEEVPPELRHIVEKCLRKDRDNRYQTTKDLLIDLKDVKQDLEFQNKLERTAPPHREKAKTQTLRVTTSDARQTTLSAEYIVTEIKQHKRSFAIGLIALLLASIGLGYWFFSNRISNNSQIESIAVLPFVNESGNTDVEYLSDGMTETLISSLSQIPKLNVKARSSVFRYKGKETDAPTIGKELNVQAILNGRVVLRGDDLVLYLELVDAQTGNQIWGDQYNKKLTNLVALQSEIARDVSSKLKIKLSGVDERELAKTYTQNTEAYRLYLRGRFLLGKTTPQDSQKAIEYFQQAIALDPNFALAYVGLANSSASFSGFNFVPPREFMPKAREFTLKALSLDDRLPEAHASLGGNLLYYDYDFTGAEREYKRAIELNPNYAEAHLEYGNLLIFLGRGEEAFAEIQRGLELDPISLPANYMYGQSLLFARRYDEAIAQFKKTLELDANYFPPHGGLGSAYLMKRDYAASIAERVKINELTGTRQRAELIQKSFDEGGWKGFLKLVTNERQILFPPHVIVTAYAELGEKDKAFALLNKLYEAREGTLVGLKVDPRFDNLRDDPRFQDLLRRVGLPQ